MTSPDSTTAPTPLLDQYGGALALGVLKTQESTAHTLLEEGKKVAEQRWFRGRGDRTAVLDPTTGDELGIVYKTDPEREAVITDRATLIDWLREDPIDTDDPLTQCAEAAKEALSDGVGQFVGILPGKTDEVIEVLREHAAHLLSEPAWRLTEQGEAAVKAAALRKGAPIMPGVLVRKPKGVLTVKVDDEGKARIRELIEADIVDPMPSLPSGPTGGA